MKSNHGFSLLETLLYLGIFAIVGGSLFGILTNMVRVTTREVSGDEVSSQLQFAIGTITRLVKDSSVIEMATSTATTTIKLRMPNSAQDPTCISLVGGVLKLAQGPDPFNKQNCTATTTDITTNKVVVESALFKRLEFPGGHDQVAVDIQLSNTATGANKISRALRSGISRASAATFDADLLPNVDATYEVGSSIVGGKRWKNGFFSGSVGIGTTAQVAKLTIAGQTQVEGNGYRRFAMQPSYWGYGNSYRTLILGSASTNYVIQDTGAISLAFGVDVSANPSPSFAGNGSELLFRNAAYFKTPDSTNTGYLDLMAFSNGNVGIGTQGPTYKLQVAGNSANSTGVWAIASDERLKRDIVPIGSALQVVTALQGVGFNWKDSAKNEQYGRVMGFIAQDVEKVLPQWVKTDPDGYKRIETIGMDALLVESIKEQQRQIESQKSDIASLRAEVDELKKRK